MKTVDYSILLNTRKSELSARDLLRVIDYLKRVIDQDTRIIAENPDAARYLSPEYSQNLLREYETEKQQRADAASADADAILEKIETYSKQIDALCAHSRRGLITVLELATETEKAAKQIKALYPKYQKARRESYKYL